MEQVQRTIGECKIVKNEYGEFVVKCWDTDNVRYSDCDYYTTDKQDAINTMQAMLKEV